MRVACAFDHAGVPFRDFVFDVVRDAGHEPVDLGDCDDYPDSALRAGRAIHDGDCERAVVVCGSGAGVSVACTKLPGIRAAVCHDTYSAAQCVEHDDCNVLCLGARIIGPVYAAHCIRAFVAASFSGAERHVRRLHKIAAMEARGFDIGSEPERTTIP
jgi:ribose 5-phosphate isomerase B